MERATTTRPDLDRQLHYTPTHNHHEARCRLRVFMEARVAVVTELDDNPGMSVTNAIEDVAQTAEAVLDVRFFGTSWRLVEHYPLRGRLAGDASPASFDLVTFSGYDRGGRLRGPGWQPIPAAMDWLRPALAGD